MKVAQWMTALLLLLGVSANQSFAATDLNAQLKQALCAQNWQQALKIVDQMRSRAPQDSDRLLQYRSQLEVLANANASIPNWPADCPGKGVAVAPPNRVTPDAPSAPTSPSAPQPSGTVQGVVDVTGINAPYRTYRVNGTVKNNTSNPVTAITVNFEIVRTQNSDGETIPEEVTAKGAANISAETLSPGEESTFEASVRTQNRGNARVVSVTWKNADGSEGSNPPKK
jgi:hypothetical protein